MDIISRVFGSDLKDPMPEFPSINIFERVVTLIMRFYNSVIMIFEVAPEKFSSTFYSPEVEGRANERGNGPLQDLDELALMAQTGPRGA